MSVNIYDANNDALTRVDCMPIGGSVSVTADGVKTFKELLSDLYGLADTDRISMASKIKYAGSYLASLQRTSGGYFYAYTNLTTAGVIDILMFCLNSSSSYCYFLENSGGTITDISSTVAQSGTKIELFY